MLRPRLDHGPFTVGMVLDVPMQDGVTYARGEVIAADATYFTVELSTLFPRSKVKYLQKSLGIIKVSDG